MPYGLFFLVPSVAIQITKGIIPINVIAINCHQPDLLTSCNLLAPAAITGINVAIAAIQYVPP